MTSLRLVFAGSPAAAVPSLTALTESRHEVATVITRADSPQGRRRTLTPTPVAVAANELGLATLRTNRLGGDVVTALAPLRPDLGVIVAYGGLVREPLLSLPRMGWINLHFSLLPRWRGAAPVQHAVIAGDEITGASVFQLVEELDAGDLLGQMTQRVGRRDSAGYLLGVLAESGAELLTRVVDTLSDGTARPEAQVGDMTSAPKLSLEDGRIDWTADSGTIDRLIRGVTPEPGAFTMIDNNRFKILDAVPSHEEAPLAPGEVAFRDGAVLVGTGSSPLRLVTVQPAGKKPMDAASWSRGRAGSAAPVMR